MNKIGNGSELQKFKLTKLPMYIQENLNTFIKNGLD